MASLTPDEKKKWLKEHIPHRIRAVLACSKRLNSELQKHGIPTYSSIGLGDIQRRCETDSIWEGRLCSLRWLIEFVGIKMGSNGKDARWQPSHKHDTWIGIIEPSAVFQCNSKDAMKLATAWKACSESSSHATTEYQNKLGIQDQEREEAVAIVIEHLSKTIYARTPNWLREFVLQPPQRP